MNASKAINKSLNSKGAKIFKKMLEDKRAIYAHLSNGGSLTDIKDNYDFATPSPLKVLDPDKTLWQNLNPDVTLR